MGDCGLEGRYMVLLDDMSVLLWFRRALYDPAG